MSNLVKRQHYVPRTYLKHFSEQIDKKYIINVLPKSAKTVDKIFTSNIEKIALQKHLYTMPGKTTEQKMAIEKFYSVNLESKYDEMYAILTNPAKVEITDNERDLIISTVVTMFYRTTKWINLHNDLVKRSFEVVYQMCQNTGKDYFKFEEEKIYLKGRSLEQLTKDYNKEQQPMMILTQLEVAMKLITLRLNNFDSITVTKLGEEKDEFITSDNPVSVHNGGIDRLIPFDPTNVMRLPLDNKHTLFLMPEGSKEFKNRIFRNTMKKTVSSMERLTYNYRQSTDSEKFIFGSKSSLTSYLATKELSEKPMSKKDFEKTKDIKYLMEKGKDLGLF